MDSSLASYYSNELAEWRDMLHFHVQEIEEFEVWLNEVLQHNTVPNLAAKTEHFFADFAAQRHQFELLAGQVYGLQTQLVKEDQPISDEQITTVLEDHHKALREQMLQSEKKFLDLKYECHQFLSDTVGRQSKGNLPGDDQTDGPVD